jgi:small subunit ribosomal protein S20
MWLVDSSPVANIKSQIKRNRQNEVRHTRNKSVRTALKTYAKRVRSAVDTDDAETAQDHLKVATRELDRAASKGILSKKTAARRKSRLARAANVAGTAESDAS